MTSIPPAFCRPVESISAAFYRMKLLKENPNLRLHEIAALQRAASLADKFEPWQAELYGHFLRLDVDGRLDKITSRILWRQLGGRKCNNQWRVEMQRVWLTPKSLTSVVPFLSVGELLRVRRVSAAFLLAADREILSRFQRGRPF